MTSGSTERSKSDIVDMLVEILGWLDANGHAMAAIDVNLAIERLSPSVKSAAEKAETR